MTEQAASVKPLGRLQKEINSIKALAGENEFSPAYGIFIDMHLPDTKFRLFLINLEKDSIVHRGLVTHGHCGNWALGKPRFSNEPGSNCSSLGNFRIGKKYVGKYGTAYKLHGLDSTNSQAFERFVVLHAHDCVPDEETSVYLCKSQGCPTVSPQMLKTLEPYLDNSELPVLLRIFF